MNTRHNSMSFENTADKGGSSFMDPGSNYGSGDSRHTMGGAEIGIISGTVILFIVLVVGLFYCRKTGILRKRRAAQLRTLGVCDERRDAVHMTHRSEMQSGNDGARSSISPASSSAGPRMLRDTHATSPVSIGWGWISLRSKKSGSGEYYSLVAWIMKQSLTYAIWKSKQIKRRRFE